MKAWLLNGIFDLNQNNAPLIWSEVSTPLVSAHEILIKISCCGVCHTELDEIEGRTPPATYPVIVGHQIVGVVAECGVNTTRFGEGDRIGVAWIYSACGACAYCLSGRENLCEQFLATGRDRNGGYAEYMAVDENFCYKIPAVLSDVESAPLLCAGSIGYRSLKLAGIGDGMTLGLTGFGASGHLILKLARHLYPKSAIHVFVRDGEEQRFAIQLGADWAGNIDGRSPHKADAIIDTTPAWTPVTESLLHLKAGGRLIINAIRKEPGDQSALLDIVYQDHLWMEKEVKTVANITRADVEEFLAIASQIPIRPEVSVYPFEKANEALLDLKHKHVRGAKVLTWI